MATVSVEIGGYSIRAMARTANETIHIELGDTPGQFVIPSAFAKDIEGKVHVGYDALRWKYDLEFVSIADVENNEQFFTKSIEALAYYIIDKTKKQTSEEINRFVFVVPNHYGNNDPRKSFIKGALNKLGISNVGFVTAHEAMCLRQAYINDRSYVLVFDMGYSGLNTSLLQRKGDNFEVLQTKKVESIGGFVFDGLIYRDMMEKCKPTEPVDMQCKGLWNDEMERISISVKERLSSENSYECPVPCSEIRYSVNRKEFENKLSSIIGVGFNVCQNMVSESGVNASEIVEVLLCGGSCRIPMVLDCCKYLFKQINPAINITNCAMMHNSVFFACNGGLIGKGNSSVTLSI